jgi:ABC-type Fe3+-hydroxamate transport system substrate-binding protein
MLPVWVAVGFLVLSGGCSNSSAKTHQGKVVSAGEGKLTMTDMGGGNQHTHAVTSETGITCGGKACTLDDLKAGVTVTVTTGQKGDQTVVSIIEAQEATS